MTATRTLAPAGTKCSPAGHGCYTETDAVHVVDGRPLCGYHSPYDVVEAKQEQEPIAGEDTYRDETAEMMARISHSMNESHARVSSTSKPDTRPHGAAYRQYISDGTGDTDGYFAPLAYDRWVIFFAGE